MLGHYDSTVISNATSQIPDSNRLGGAGKGSAGR
jgi:hypothetical protein